MGKSLPLLALPIVFWLTAPPGLAQSESSSNAGSEGQTGTFLGAKETEHPEWFKESFLEFEDDIAEAAAEDKRLVLYFWQPGCPYCNALIEQNFGQRDISDFVQNKFQLVALNMWGDREIVHVGGKQFTEKTMAEALRVNFTPTLVFFDEKGKVVLRLNGYYPPDEFRVALDYVSMKEEANGPYHEYAAARQAPVESGEILSEPFLRTAPVDLQSDLQAKDGPVAIYFEQKQCRQCDLLHNKVLTDKVTRELAKGIDSVQLDMWSDTLLTIPDGRQVSARDWAQELGVTYAPTIVFIDGSGNEIIRMEAFFKTFHTQSLFDYVQSGAYQDQPSFQRYLQARADHLIEQGIDVDIWSY